MVTLQELRAKVRAGQPTVGTWIQVPTPEVVELIAPMEYDWAAVDLVHAAPSAQVMEEVFNVLKAWGTLPFARLSGPVREEVHTALACGAEGLIVPGLHGKQELARLVSWSAEFSRDVAIVAQVENICALQDMDELFSCSDLDAYMVSPYDFSASMGLCGQFHHPKFLGALRALEERAAAHGLAKGYHVVKPEPHILRQLLQKGYVFLVYGVDALFLQSVTPADDPRSPGLPLPLFHPA